jgi:hypothetical protein
VLQPDTVLQPVSLQRDVTPQETSLVTSPDPVTLQQLITVLQRELDAAHTREEAAREREALLLQMVQQLQQQNQRLLDMPRHGAVPVSTPSAPAGQEAPRGEMRQRIVALLREYPEGLSPVQVRELLGVDKNLADTCFAMARDGLLRRVGHGLYVAAAPSRNER